MHLKDTHVTELPDFIVVEEFHAARAFIKVVAEGDAAVPVLDLDGAPTKRKAFILRMGRKTKAMLGD